MKIVSINSPDMSAYGKISTCNVHTVHIKITDVDSRAKDMIQIISNTSWINKLGVVEQATFAATSERTIKKLVNDIFNKVNSVVTVEFGEYMISDTAQTILVNSFGHNRIPLAELLKEKVTGNPGFDFHTESATNYIAYGEAKYSGKINPYTKALEQIIEFIELKKDIAELIILKNFASDKAVGEAIAGSKAYVAAFSINSANANIIFNSVLTSDLIDNLLVYPELYIVGVEVND